MFYTVDAQIGHQYFPVKTAPDHPRQQSLKPIKMAPSDTDSYLLRYKATHNHAELPRADRDLVNSRSITNPIRSVSV